MIYRTNVKRFLGTLNFYVMKDLLLNATPILQGCAIAISAVVLTIRMGLKKKQAKLQQEASQAAARRRFEVFRY